ncbi:centrosomal protein of 70 kDa isoform X1 [Aquarana catesbeiana]|uniref:centrosomal protein of 70 kDa isoform X1 n=1 Tax=Aquarana catesbeiana TaxID=8400 RepID=UPI003CC9460B
METRVKTLNKMSRLNGKLYLLITQVATSEISQRIQANQEAQVVYEEGGIGLDSQASQALRSAIRSLVEDTERRQNLIHGLIQTNNQLKEDVRLQHNRAGRQEQKANELQRILDSVRTKIRDLEDDFIAKMRQQQTEMTNLLQEKKVVHGGAVISPYTLQALVSHFQNLFDVPSLSGVYPRMNEVYSRLGEVTNAMKNLRNILGLDDAAGIGTVVNAVWGMCRNAEEGNCQKLQDVLGPLDIDSIINKIQEHEEFFPAFEDLVKGLLDILEIRHLEEILPEVLRLKALDSR